MGTFNAEPSKDFFIDMLTRDIALEWAILDLIDNSVDGARDVITKKGKSLTTANAYKGFWIELNFNEKEFTIQDNCGGFSKKAATEYAFKFGRPKDAAGFPKGSVGRFGVGMKRGIFKIGSSFVVETKTSRDHYFVEEDIEKWNSPGKPWQFEYTDISDTKGRKGYKSMLKENGTYIKITKIKEGVKNEFASNSFKKMLNSEIQRILSYSIKRGLEVIVNGESLTAKPIELLVSDQLSPYFLEETINTVNVKIYAGIGPPDPNEAGWYIFCNDRLMVEHDKTNLTGWEGSEKFLGDSGVQKFHNKVAMFRGLVFFTADDSSLLPMTTTKTGIDINSTLYKTTRSKMVTAMSVVLSYLNKLDKHEQRQAIVDKSKAVDIVSYPDKKLTTNFVFPEPKKKTADDNLVKISYSVDKDLAKDVKKSLSVTTNEQIGLGTFNYYVKMKEL